MVEECITFYARFTHMKRAYAHIALKEDSLQRIQTALGIINEYRAQGFTLTLRQLYYQHVARGLIPNKQTEYKKLGSLITNGRMAGYIDWHDIEDRTRSLRTNAHWDSPASIIDAVAEQFRFDLWEEQPERIEVWIEKDALIGVVEEACADLDVAYFSCRGYVSTSAMKEASERITQYLIDGQRVTILYLGDHDPSGMQMTEDIRGRLEMFCDQDTNRFGMSDEFSVPTIKRIALSMEQIEELSPPPNPAKTTDPRAKAYIEEYGEESWELDALEPAMIVGLIRDEIDEIMDPDLHEEALDRQQEARLQLSELAGEARARWTL